MLYIDPNSLKARYAKREFLEKMLEFIYKRIDSIKSTYSIRFIEKYILYDLEKILIGHPEEILELHYFYNCQFDKDIKLRKDIDYIFNYKIFTKKKKKLYDAYNLAEALDITTCTYCNRNYTNTIITIDGEKKSRPQFDHYFDKKNYPLLKLSFYNLIPSCSICNSGIKLNQKFLPRTHNHPYLDKSVSEFKFSYNYSIESKSGLKITLNSKKGSKTANTLKNMDLEVIYNANIDVLQDLLKIKQSYSDKYLTILSRQVLNGINLSQSELYRLAFGSHFDEDKFFERPFSKFKKDILSELKIIK